MNERRIVPRGLRWRCSGSLALVAVMHGADLRAQVAPRDTSRTADTERSTMQLGSSGDVRLSLGGYLQVDGRVLSGNVPTPPAGLLLRRARLVFDARMPSGWHVRLQPDFGQSRVVVQDAYVGWQQRGTVVRIGRFRPAYGVERFQSSSTLLHGERSFVNSLMPSRSFGTQMQHAWRTWSVSVGGFRTPIGAGQQTVDTDGDDQAVPGSGYDVLARIAWAPRRGARYADVQLAALAGRERGESDAPGLTRLLTVGQEALLAFRGDGTETGTVVADGGRYRVSLGGVAGDARTMVALEGALFTQRAAFRGLHRTVSSGGIVWRAAHLIGGRRLASQDIIPTTSRGAFDIGVRFGTLGVWGDDIGVVLTRRSVTHAVSGGVAVAWIPTPLTRLALAYDQTHVSRESGVREHLLLLRVQQGF